MMAIILEGPDGSGKTTLKKTLLEHYPLYLKEMPRFSTSTGGPHEGLGHLVNNDLEHWFDDSDLHVPLYDRYPLISDPIYSVATGRDHDPTLALVDPSTVRQMKRNALVILCLPPLAVTTANIAKEEQMAGVEDNIAHIWAMYYDLSLSDEWKNLHYYNYIDSYCNEDLTAVMDYYLEGRIG